MSSLVGEYQGWQETMATSTKAGTRNQRPLPSGRTNNKKKNVKEKEEAKSGPKRALTYLLVVALLLCGFYLFRNYQMVQIRASLDKQIESAERANASDIGSLRNTLEQVRAKYPTSDAYSADPVFNQEPMAGRIESRTAQIIMDSETEIRETRARTPFIFLTDIIMPGAQQSTDDYYRASIKAYVTSAEYVEFNATKLRVDDLMSAVRFCQGETTALQYGYTDPEPDALTKDQRATVINAAAVRRLCPEKG
jgi:hypothetical protein